MNPLSKDARQILGQYKTDESPPADELNRLLDVVEQRGARGDVCRFEVNTSLPALSKQSWWLRARTSTLGKVSMTVVALGVPAGVVIATRAPTTRATPAKVRVVAAPVAIPTSTAPAETASIGEPSAFAAPPVASDVAERVLEPLPQPPQAAGTPNNRRATKDTIDGEIRLLNAAQSALRSGDATRALSLLDEDAARFPDGRLHDARTVTHMLALCQLGRAAAARQEADRFMASRPKSPFTDRVKKICMAKGVQ